MKFGTLQSVLDVPLSSVFRVAARLGFDGVELDWDSYEEALPGGRLGPERRPAIRAAAARAGVDIPSVAAHFLNRGGLAGAASEAFGLEAVRAGIALCAQLGAGHLLVPFFGAAMIRSEESISRLAANLGRLAPEAAAAGVVLAIEHTLRGEASAALVDRVGASHIGAYWDMANCMALGYDPLRDIEEQGARIVRVHAKEYCRGKGPAGAPDRPRFDGLNAVPFGQGDVPVAAVLAALREAGYDGYVVLETGGFDDARRSAQEALALLRRLGAAPA